MTNERKGHAVPEELSGPVVYCPVCRNKIGSYRPAAGKAAVPVPGPVCRGCKRRKKLDKSKKVPGEQGTSVRTVSGGLPTLGKGPK